ncbi:hypothetical protein ASE01_01370 [Nocardioides sp. Root190]|uniref:hypothetical protein n=1 Tax=Nocardioides sp. Root190 TaxID=1736488 RepID=UPI0007004ECF|nr:hypothetical protein [Nocardioides sp. Root190]KRB80176.1 hypothetical protein ASE01_01370 [Nocardioides sp. Root190]
MGHNVPGLAAAIKRVIEAAIEAEMSDFNYYGNCRDGFEGYSRPTEELPVSDPIRISYPDGKVFLYGNIEVDHVQANFVGQYTDATQLYEKWDEEIRQNFERFEDAPQPVTFDFPVQRLGELATALDAGGAYLDGEGSSSSSGHGNLDLAVLLSEIMTEIGPRQGAAMEALRRSYLGRLGNVIAGQQVLVAGLGVVVEGERQVWVDNTEDLLDIADKAEAAFRRYASGGGGDTSLIKTGFAVISGLATIASGFIAGPGVLVVAGLSATLSAAIPDVEQPPELEFEASSVSGVHGNLLLALSAHCRAVSETERAYADCADTLVARAVANPDYYDLTAPGTSVPFVDGGPGEEYFGPGETIDVHGPELLEAAGLVEVVARTLDLVSGDLPALNGWPWERYFLVGYGRRGHHTETTHLREQATSVLSRTATTLHEVAQKMVLVANDFSRSDDDVRTDLDVLVRAVDDPTPGQDVAYGYDEVVVEAS